MSESEIFSSHIVEEQNVYTKASYESYIYLYTYIILYIYI